MTIEEKAIEAYNKNRELKPKYHIEEEAWIEWFEEGYKRAQEDRPQIKPLEFKDGIAITPIGTYSITVDNYSQNYTGRSPKDEFICLATKEEWVIDECNKHYCELIMSCLTNTEANE